MARLVEEHYYTEDFDYTEWKNVSRANKQKEEARMINKMVTYNNYPDIIINHNSGVSEPYEVQMKCYMYSDIDRISSALLFAKTNYKKYDKPLYKRTINKDYKYYSDYVLDFKNINEMNRFIEAYDYIYYNC